MAGAIANGRGNGNGRLNGSRYRPMSEINVTPLVDVMLVLLVVFMVTAPLLTVGVPVDLPQTAAPPINEPKEPTVITVNKEGEIFIQDTSIPMDGLVAKLQAVTNSNPDAVLYVRGDKDISYGKVLEVMSLISNAGFHKVSLVAEAPKGGPTTPLATPPSGQAPAAPAHAGAR
jgi:biopolymer transport protein TolR